jgi:hypothetical protein
MLREMNVYKSPGDKLACIMNCCRAISTMLAAMSSEGCVGIPSLLATCAVVRIDPVPCLAAAAATQSEPTSSCRRSYTRCCMQTRRSSAQTCGNSCASARMAYVASLACLCDVVRARAPCFVLRFIGEYRHPSKLMSEQVRRCWCTTRSLRGCTRACGRVCRGIGLRTSFRRCRISRPWMRSRYA